MNPSDQNPNPEFECAWERRLDAQLRQLPELEAPADLVPNVMALVRTREAQRARAWWRRPASTWHPALRVSFGITGVVVLAALILGTHLLWPELLATSAAKTVSAIGAKLAALWEAGRTLYAAIGKVVGAIVTPTRLAIGAAIILSQVLLLSAGGAALRANLISQRPMTPS
jgi:hypothetical protein